MGSTYRRRSTNGWWPIEGLPAFSLTLQIQCPVLDGESWGRYSYACCSHRMSLQMCILKNRRVLFWGKVLEGDGICGEVVTEDWRSGTFGKIFWTGMRFVGSSTVMYLHWRYDVFKVAIKLAIWVKTRSEGSYKKSSTRRNIVTERNNIHMAVLLPFTFAFDFVTRACLSSSCASNLNERIFLFLFPFYGAMGCHCVTLYCWWAKLGIACGTLVSAWRIFMVCAQWLQVLPQHKMDRERLTEQSKDWIDRQNG